MGGQPNDGAYAAQDLGAAASARGCVRPLAEYLRGRSSRFGPLSPPLPQPCPHRKTGIAATNRRADDDESGS